jgi:type II secretory pathway pseudopilin PulG
MVPGQWTRRQGADPARARRAGGGFTLAELLIVIGIMVVLIAIALPSGIAMRRQSRRATCAANLKALGQALLLFREDYQCFPPDRDEYLWTKEAHDAYVAQFGVEPPNYDPTSLTAAAYYPDGTPIPTTVTDPATGVTYPLHGLGLYTLYYLGSYSSVLPPADSDPRFTVEALANAGVTVDRREGLNQRSLSWFKGAGYITELGTFHCPENTDADLDRAALVDRRRLPLLTTPTQLSWWDEATQEWKTGDVDVAWNNYDLFYHRNQWHPGLKPEAAPEPTQGARHLLQPYPPADTVVTWCPYHRKDTRRRATAGPRRPAHVGPHQSTPPAPAATQAQGPPTTEVRDFNRVSPGDLDLVLFADGSVRRLTSRADNKMYEAPPGDTGWPQGPLM